MVNGWETAKKNRINKEARARKEKNRKKPGGIKRGRVKKQETAKKTRTNKEVRARKEKNREKTQRDEDRQGKETRNCEKNPNK